MADEFTWALSEIRTEFRALIGLSETTDILDATCNKWINDYYTNYFAEDAKVSNFDGDYTQETSCYDDGEYTLAQTVMKLLEPMTLNGEPIIFFEDKKQFFEQYPKDEQYITDPTLAIGSSDSAKVATSAFKYDIQGDSYAKAATETAFSGLETVPQNKYGAFCLKITTAGTITIYEADDNVTGYDSPGLAIEDLPVADSDTAYLGYVTVISTDSGGFVPGTTALDDSAVTDTYTDGKEGNRNTPEGALVKDNKLYLRPKPNRVFLFECASIERPTAFADDTAVPDDVKWGPMIALGAAVLYLATIGNQNRIIELVGHPVSLVDFRVHSIARKKRKQESTRSAMASF